MFKFTKLLSLLLLLNVPCTYALDTPTEDFIDNKDGTVTHKKTGLTWQRCSVGQTWTGSNCNGSTNVFRYLDSLSQTSNFAGYSDWRIPRIDEIASIVEYGVSPSINSAIFPNTPTGFYAPYTFLNYMFWSSTFVASNPDRMYMLNFTTGEIIPDERRSTNTSLMNDYRSIRFVRGGHSLSILGEFTPSSDFLDNGNGTVTHKTTSLTWQRCNVGQTWDGITCNGVPSNIPFSKVSSKNDTFAGFSDWRLPTISELLTIVEYSINSPSINAKLFPNTKSDVFWTSTKSFINTDNLRQVEFFSGSTYGSYGGSPSNSNLSARLVRGTWTASTSTPIVSTTFDLSTMLSQSTSRIQKNTSITYTATVLNNGTGTANNSLLKIYFPPRNVSIVSMPSDCVTTGKSITCSLGSLAAGASVTRLLKVSYTKSGGSSVSALVLTDSDDTNLGNNVSRIVTAITK